MLDIIIASVHCYHYNDHSYNVTSSSILFYVKFDGRLSRNIFHGGQVLCRNQSIDLQCKSFDWLLYGADFVGRGGGGGCSRTDFSSLYFCQLYFCQYLFYHWFNLIVTGLSKSSNGSFLSIHAGR